MAKGKGIFSSAKGIVPGTPSEDVNRTRTLKVLSGLANKCPSCGGAHRCSEGYYCRADQSFHQCTNGKCGGKMGTYWKSTDVASTKEYAKQ